ncbi:MAG TPA: outer membrane beta-barrel protein [Hanamia sp.]|nr:outer membrane beta-barrel protein [Hanamia sp.]
MDKNLHDIEDLFRKGLEDNEEIPPENTWNRIDKILDKDKIISINKKYARLKRIVFLLMFLLAGLSIYDWNNRNKNNPDKINSAILNNGEKTKNNNADLSSAINKNANADNNQRLITKIGKSNIADNILKQPHKKSEESISSFSRVNDTNSSVSKPGKKSEKTILASTNKNLKSSITKQRKTKENIFGIKTPAQIENEHDVVVNHINSDSIKRLLSLIQFNSLSVTKMKSTTELIETKKILPTTALSKPNFKINNSKNIFQKQTIKSQKKSQFYVTGFFSPEISFSRMHDNHSGNQNGNTTDAENNETETFSYIFGTLIEYKTGRHWSLQSGFTLSTRNRDIDPCTIYAKPDNTGTIKYQINTSSGYGYILPSFSNNPNVGDSIFSKSTTNTLQYLGIPLSVKYSINKGKFTLNAMTGISPNFLTQGKITTEVEKGNDNEMETAVKIIGLKKFYLSGMAGIGLDYNFYKNLSADFSPTIRFALNPINDEVPVKSFPNSLGVSLGLKLKL